MNAAYAYLLASARNGTLYIGVTTDLIRRVHEHREASDASFSARYGVKTLVWFETHDSIGAAIQRETSLKRWKRAWKLALIEKDNPTWRDLWPDIIA